MIPKTMSRFSVFIGTWNTTGDVFPIGDLPSSAVIATDTYRWLPGQHFILHEADARFGGAVSRSIEVMGYNSKRKRHVSRSYDDQGKSEDFVLELRGRRWSITGATVRFNGSFDAARNRLSGLWEMKPPKSRWRPWIDLKLERA
jgi:hypothetical protein